MPFLDYETTSGRVKMAQVTRTTVEREKNPHFQRMRLLIEKSRAELDGVRNQFTDRSFFSLFPGADPELSQGELSKNNKEVCRISELFHSPS
jgi:hypothetical protein